VVAKALPAGHRATGTAAVAATGFAFVGERVSVVKLAGIVLIIGGVVLLNAGVAHPVT
jgi:small multidrug resistance pump